MRIAKSQFTILEILAVMMCEANSYDGRPALGRPALGAPSKILYSRDIHALPRMYINMGRQACWYLRSYYCSTAVRMTRYLPKLP